MTSLRLKKRRACSEMSDLNDEPSQQTDLLDTEIAYVSDDKDRISDH